MTAPDERDERGEPPPVSDGSSEDELADELARLMGQRFVDTSDEGG